MKKITVMFTLVLVIVGMCASAAYADADKGMKVYKKFMKTQTGIDGGKFATRHSQDEWSDLFSDDAGAFKSECVEAFPNSAEFIESDKFNRLKPHLLDFLIKYANDSGNIPKC